MGNNFLLLVRRLLWIIPGELTPWEIRVLIERDLLSNESHVCFLTVSVVTLSILERRHCLHKFG